MAPRGDAPSLSSGSIRATSLTAVDDPAASAFKRSRTKAVGASGKFGTFWEIGPSSLIARLMMARGGKASENVGQRGLSVAMRTTHLRQADLNLLAVSTVLPRSGMLPETELFILGTVSAC
jgi:hypothetical protein